jgi:glucosamine kinase
LTQHFFIGVDGGATKCIVRVEDAAGNVLGEEISGPANIRISVDQAWHSIYSTLNTILNKHAISQENGDCHFHLGIGIAGCEIPETYQAFLHYPSQRPHFTTLVVTSDAHIACLAAHGGKDGAIIIAGTGVVGYQIDQGKITKVSGWGFPHDDEGGGAWIGLQAVKITLQYLDGRLPSSALARGVEARFHNDREHLVDWANQANSTLFAELAPLVIQFSQQGDEMAKRVLEQAARTIDSVAIALVKAQREPQTFLPCTLTGGVAPFLQPLVGPVLRSRLCPGMSTPVEGAILFVRQHREKNTEEGKWQK